MTASPNTLSAGARRLIRQEFGKGAKSCLSTADAPIVTAANQSELDELVAAKMITARRKPKFPEHTLYRGTDACAAIFLDMVRGAVPLAGVADPVDPKRDQVGFEMLPDPHLTDAEYYHQRRERKDSGDPYVGMAPVAVDLRERLGGFAAFKKRTSAQEEAAARFRRIYDMAHRSGVQAIDYRNNKVDSSPFMSSAFAGESGMLDAADSYRHAVRMLGMLRSSLVERIVVHDIPMRKIATGSRARERAAAELRAALEQLAVHFRLVPFVAA
jgi:hypothetical protein